MVFTITMIPLLKKKCNSEEDAWDVLVNIGLEQTLLYTHTQFCSNYNIEVL